MFILYFIYNVVFCETKNLPLGSKVGESIDYYSCHAISYPNKRLLNDHQLSATGLLRHSYDSNCLFYRFSCVKYRQFRDAPSKRRGTFRFLSYRRYRSFAANTPCFSSSVRSRSCSSGGIGSARLLRLYDAALEQCHNGNYRRTAQNTHGQVTQSTRDRPEQRLATKARSHQTDDRRLARS